MSLGKTHKPSLFLDNHPFVLKDYRKFTNTLDNLSLRQREQILSESRRILKSGAILSILPFHMAGGQIKELIHTVENLGFESDGIQRGAGLHFEMHRYLNRKSEHLKDYERGDIYNFRKRDSL